MRKRIAVALLIGALCSSCKTDHRAIMVGCKKFAEQRILQHIVAGHLRENNFKVEVAEPEGSNLEAHRALLDDDIDLYPEYTGTAFSLVLNHCCIDKPPGPVDVGKPLGPADAAGQYRVIQNRVLEAVRAEYRGMDLEWLDPLGFDNSWAIVGGRSAPTTLSAAVRPEGLAASTSETPLGYRLVVGPDFLERPDGFRALMAAYPIRWAEAPEVVDKVDISDLCATNQGPTEGGAKQARQASAGKLLAVGKTTPLKDGCHAVADDRQAFLPYEACLVVRKATLEAEPRLRRVLLKLNRLIKIEDMMMLNRAADQCRAAPHCYDDVAASWLKTHPRP